jgi:hypothetical protein
LKDKYVPLHLLSEEQHQRSSDTPAAEFGEDMSYVDLMGKVDV